MGKQADQSSSSSQQGAATATSVGPAGRPVRDWDRAERLYRAGTLSNYEIATQCGVTRQALEKHAKKHGWKKDLTARVKQAVATKLVAAEVAKKARAQPATEAEIIEEASNVGVEVVQHHRKDIRRGRLIVNALFSQLETACLNRVALEDEIDAEHAEQLAEAANSDGHIPAADVQRLQARRQLMRRSISLPQHAAVARDLAMSLKHLVGIERQAFGIGEPEEGAGVTPDTPAVSYDVHFGV